VIRLTLLEGCREELSAIGLTPETAGDDLDLREAGIVDSLGFVELIVGLEQELGVDLDLDRLEPGRLTVVEALVELACAQLARTAPLPGS
jgi:acyl carrier protein